MKDFVGINMHGTTIKNPIINSDYTLGYIVNGNAKRRVENIVNWKQLTLNKVGITEIAWRNNSGRPLHPL
jgi:hypothetical protein